MSKKDGSLFFRAACGQKRCRAVFRIHEALAERGLKSVDLARALGISTSAMSQTLTGKQHSARVLDALRDAGVPEKYLYDPRRVTVEEVA